MQHGETDGRNLRAAEGDDDEKCADDEGKGEDSEGDASVIRSSSGLPSAEASAAAVATLGPILLLAACDAVLMPRFATC